MNKILAKAGRKLSSSGDDSKNRKKIDDDKRLFEEAENYYANRNETVESHSRLAKNLHVILTEKNCLCYFIQFLETCNALHLIKFWLDVENFRTAAELCNSDNTTTACKSNNYSPKVQTNKIPNSDSLSNDLCSVLPKRRNNLTQSVSSEGYDSLSFISNNDFDTLSNNSFSENNLDDVGEEDSVIADTIEEVVGQIKEKSISCEENEKPTDTNDANADAASTNSSNADPHSKETYDQHHLSLTDDEKYQMNEKKKNHAQENDPKLKNGHLPKPPPHITVPSNIQSMIIADAIKIYKKYLIANSAYYIDIPATIAANISLSLCGESVSSSTDAAAIEKLPTSNLPLNIFHEAQKYILELLENGYLNSFLDSTFYCKYTIDILTSDNLALSDILYCESALFYFMEFLEQDNKHLLLEFWLTATNFKRQLQTCQDNSYDKEQVQADALVLYEKYFSLQATTTTLNLSNQVRSRVEENICQVSGPSANCFDLPVGVIEYYLERKYLKEFLKSQLFCKYLTEMFNRIQENKAEAAQSPEVVSKKTRHRKTYSDCTSDKAKSVKKSFMSCQNTLLAMESNMFGGNTMNRSLHTDSLQINSQLMTNPDLLWQRNPTGSNGLTFGRINALGRYERDFDMELIEEKGALASGGDLLKKAVKKLVHLPESEVQEEMAWQVAEMIIKDITDITLKRNDNGGT